MVGIDELNDTVIEEKTLKSGVTGGNAKPVPQEKTNDVRAVRYCFNPWLHVDLTNRTAPVGHMYLDNGKVIRIDPVQIRQAIHKTDEINFSPVAGAGSGDYEFPVRQPGVVMAELLEAYAAFGFIELESIRGLEDDNFIENLSLNLLGEEIPSKTDVYIPDFPVPILPLWFEQITANAKEILANKTLSSELVKIVQGVYRELSASFRTGISSAKEITQEANRRLIDPNEKNKTFSARERRAYLALGEEIPDTMPTVSASSNVRTARLEEAFVNALNRGNPNEIPRNAPQPAPETDQRISKLEETIAEQAETIQSATDLIKQQSALIQEISGRLFSEKTDVKELDPNGENITTEAKSADKTKPAKNGK